MAISARPLARVRLADELADRIVQMIRSGEFRPGERLPAIVDLARSFGVGSPTLREALKKLESVGVVDIRHGSGVYVTRDPDTLVVVNPVCRPEATREAMLDLIDTRMLIEVETAAQAAEKATAAQLAEMDRLLDEAGGQLDNDRKLSEFNMAFHHEIARASGNAVTMQVIVVLTTLFQHEQHAILKVYGSRAGDWAERRSILEALNLHDPKLARERMRDHLQGVRDRLLAWDKETLPLG